MGAAWLCLLCAASAGLVPLGTGGEQRLWAAPRREEPELLLPRGVDARGAGVEALQEVLEKLRSRELPPTAKKPGRVPSCQLGEPCAVRVGARFGKRCSCPPGTACNLYILRCA
ncbi:cocaine- and amphetamine-regulated transcript protein-like [Lagopus muta]|uniref:cocaine- and amphetamine-regulated transcript protein-like n=1 Tax=Lagopus leucura TaxID=30410 RepID=UPI001C66E37B|nr:cocaine- and amphetamine-regulated transcript protein-like [Lagopus leucura]XP_048783615.1 cocaine- and amphetamine-regulated transcript protein-like [Lagopus muta]